MRPQTASVQVGLLEAYAGHLDRLCRLGALAHSTRLECHRVARTFLAYYPRVPLERFTPEHIERYLTESRPLSPRTMHTDLMRLRGFFRWCVIDQCLLKTNPCDHVTKPRYHETLQPSVTDEEFLRLCHACRTLEQIAIVEVLYHTGLRMNELCRLRRDTVDLDAGWAQTIGKGNRAGYVFFTPEVADVLRAHLAASPMSPWVFQAPRRPDHPRHSDWVNAILHRLGREAGLSYTLTAHLMRHGLAWTLKMTDMPMSAIQKIMRHRNIQTTIDLYGRLGPQDVKRLYDQHMGRRKA